VEIIIHVPAGARIWFDGQETTQTGSERVFISPPLDPGRDFAYELRVQWHDGDRLVERTRHLTVRAGDHIGLDYTGRGFVEVRGYTSEAPAAVPARALVLRYVPVYWPEPAQAPAAPRLYDRGPPAGPPGSNSPMSLGVGNG
jgi:uncharacterized protein (TIGR03000 family)